MTDYTITVSERQAEELCNACEILARLNLGQIGDALRELPLAQPLDHETQRSIEMVLESFFKKGPKKGMPIAWDLHQVIRHRLAWDRAYREGIVKPGERRNWNKMMSVIYDSPLSVGDEPLAKIERAGGDQ